MLIVLNCGRDIIAYFVFWNPMISKSFGTLIPCSIAAFMNMTATESRTANAASGAALFPFIGDLAIWKPLVLIIVLKFVGANAMRFWVNKMDKKEEA